MSNISGIGPVSRERLSRVLRNSKGVITVDLVSESLNISNNEAGKLLSNWTKQDWLYRIKRGIYIPVPIESSGGEPAIEDPWIIAAVVFSPCYIGGWTAAGYRDLSEQLFKSICVITLRNKRNKEVKIGTVDFYVKTISSVELSGYNSIWRGQIKVNVSDPSKTIADMLDDVKPGGGIRPVTDILTNYMKSPHKDLNKVIRYAEQIGNKTVYKRLGFLLERGFPDESDTIKLCQDKISAGYTKLDPALESDTIVTRWNLIVPAYWKTCHPARSFY